MVKAAYLRAAIFIMIIIGSVSAAAYDPPELAEPADSAQCLGPEVQFSWAGNDISEVEQFRLEIADDPTFSNIIYEQTTASDVQLNVSVPLGDEIFWRVSATFTDMSVETSETRYFTSTTAEPEELLYPEPDQECVENNLNFQWSEAPSAESYNLQVALTNDFNQPVVNATSITSTTYSVKLDQYEKQYYWRVSSNKNNCTSDWSDQQVFNTTKKPPEKETPADETTGVGLEPDLTWLVSNDFDEYEIQISDNTGFDEPIISHSATYTGQSSATYTASLDEYNTTYYWRIKGSSTFSCSSDWSESWSFKTKYHAPEPVSPQEDAECVPITALFDWEDMPEVSGYRLQIAADSEFDDIYLDQPGITESSYEEELANYHSTYYWRVRAEDTENTGYWSESRRFRTTVRPPQLLDPDDSTTGMPQSVDLNWEDFGEDAIYRLQLSDDPDFGNTYIDVGSSSTFSVTLPEYNTNYYWRVSSTYSGCESEWSEVFTFKTAITPPDLRFPDDGNVRESLVPTFIWQVVDQAETYDLEIADDPEFNNVIAGRRGIPGNWTTFKNMPPDTKLYWHVRARNNEGYSEWSEVFTFTTSQQGPEVPVLLYPDNGEVMLPLTLTLDWSDAERADFYELQVSDDPAFQTVIVNVTESAGLTESEYALNNLENYTNYLWRVRSVNDSGKSAWTDIHQFRTIAIPPDDAPQLTEPEDGTELQKLRATFRWNDVPGATAYKLELATDESFSNIVFSDPNIFLGFKVYSQLDPVLTYYWRVRAFNEAGEGPWSEPFEFSTFDPAPVYERFTDRKDIKVYPNPAANRAELTFDLKKTGRINIYLYDAEGNLSGILYEGIANEGNNSIKLDLNAYSSGAYTIVIGTETGRIAGRIIINK
ncbi:MAG: fibronectin type III domain-containing protein [Candidatus Kapaibacterium sp.]